MVANDGDTGFQLWRYTANEAPTGIALSAASIAENNAIGAVIGTLTATDPDAGDSVTYALVAGEGDADNAAFTLDGGVLKAARSFNFEVRQSSSRRWGSPARPPAWRSARSGRSGCFRPGRRNWPAA